MSVAKINIVKLAVKPKAGACCYCETPIPCAQHDGIGKSNYPAKQGIIPRSELAIKFPKLPLGFIPVIERVIYRIFQ
jgi:hypothetical protein